MYSVHPSTDTSVDILTDSRPMYRPIYQPTLDRYVGRHIYRHSADISTKICLSTYRPIYRSIVARYSTDMSVNMSTESGCLIVGQHVDREATDISPILHWYLATGHRTLRRRRNVTKVCHVCWAVQISLYIHVYIPRFSEASLYKPSVVSWTKPNPKKKKQSNSIEPDRFGNRTLSNWNFSVSSITEFNRTPCIWSSLTTKIFQLTQN